MAAVQKPHKETAGSGTAALKLEVELIESIIHRLGDILNCFISESHTLKNFNIKIFGYNILFVFMISVKCESLLLNVVYFYFICITQKIACITLLLKIFINNLNVSF